jgi:D-proline reductase (dithiol) PrdB
MNNFIFFDKTGFDAERRQVKFEQWLVSLPKWHDHFTFTPCLQTYWTPLQKPLSECRVALVTTAGVHLQSQPPFDVNSPDGDWSYRMLPSDAEPGDFAVSDSHYDHSDADRDIDCVFGLHRLRELAEEGFIGQVAPRHFGLMGFIPDPVHLINFTAPEIAAMLVQDQVDLVLLTPG